MAHTSAIDHGEVEVMTRAAFSRPPKLICSGDQSDQDGLRPLAKDQSTHPQFQHSRHHHFVFHSLPQHTHLKIVIVERVSWWEKTHLGLTCWYSLVG